MQYRQQPSQATPSPRGVKRRRALVLAGGLIALVLVSSLGADAVFLGGRGASAVAAAARDPMSLFGKRSPGHRGYGLLQQTKPGHPAKAFSERGGQKPPPPAAPEKMAMVVPPAAPVPGPMAFPVALPGEAPTPFSGDAIMTPPPLEWAPPSPGEQEYIWPPGGGGGTPSTPGGFPGGSVPETPGVPEASVWAMLIVGFFGVGGLMRLQRRQASDLAHDLGR